MLQSKMNGLDPEVIKHEFVIFGEEHYNPLGAIRSLGEVGINPIAIIIKSRFTIASSSKYIKKLYMVDNLEEGYQILLDKFGKAEKKVFVITTDDLITSYLDKHYDEIKDLFYFNNAGKSLAVTFYMNKNNINLLAQKHGLQVAKTNLVVKGEIPDDLDYPIITKSISSNDGGWKDDVFICNDREELAQAYKKIKGDRLLLQKYIEKENELCIDGFSVDHGNEVVYTIATDYNYILPGKYSCDMNVYNVQNAFIKEKVSEMIKDIGFEGIFCVEFLRDKNNNYYFLEINFRNSGWSYVSTCAGMNIPYLWARGMVHGEAPGDYYVSIPEGFRAIVEFPDFKYRVIEQKMNIFKWIKNIRNCKCLFFFNKKDPKPFWTTLYSKIRVALTLR